MGLGSFFERIRFAYSEMTTLNRQFDDIHEGASYRVDILKTWKQKPCISLSKNSFHNLLIALQIWVTVLNKSSYCWRMIA